jgi:hypothetical protein
MWKRIAAVCAVVLYIAALWPAYLIGVLLGLWQPLTRPASVPWRAWYVSAFKTEAWFDCSVDRRRDVDTCKAWDDEGHLIAFGNYRLDGENRAATEFELRPSMVIRDSCQPLERFEVSIGDGQ